MLVLKAYQACEFNSITPPLQYPTIPIQIQIKKAGQSSKTARLFLKYFLIKVSTQSQPSSLKFLLRFQFE